MTDKQIADEVFDAMSGRTKCPGCGELMRPGEGEVTATDFTLTVEEVCQCCGYFAADDGNIYKITR